MTLLAIFQPDNQIGIYTKIIRKKKKEQDPKNDKHFTGKLLPKNIYVNCL